MSSTPQLPEGVPAASAGAAPIDLQALTQMANAFFKSVPGRNGDPLSLSAPRGVQAPANPAPAGSPLASPAGLAPNVPGTPIPQGLVPGANLLPASPSGLPPLAYRAPALVPHAEAGNRAPESLYSQLPAYSPEFGGGATGVAAPQTSPGQGGYYFLPSSGAVPAYQGGKARAPKQQDPLDELAVQAAPDGRVVESAAASQARPAALAPAQGGQVRNPGFGFPDVGDLSSASSAGNTPVSRPVGAGQPGTPTKSPYLAPVHQPGIIDVEAIRADFPILKEEVNGHRLVWLDNGATTQKPQAVIDRLAFFYQHENSNIHRAAHELAARATDAYEGARETVRRFINAPDVNEVIFTRGTTEAINLVAKSWGGKFVGAGDEIILSHLEHHANIVPWQQLAAEKGAIIKVIPVDDSGQLLLDEYAKLLSPRTRIVSLAQVSNVLGTVTPVEQITAMAHAVGARVLIDGAQSVAHHPTDVQHIGADFFVFSGHKIFGPTGIGALWGRREVLEQMPPWQSGGNMIADVTFERTLYQPIPNTFEAGTGNIADAVGLGAALDYVSEVGIEKINAYEHSLVQYASERLADIPGLRLIGTAPGKAAVISFTLAGCSNDEVGQALNKEGVAVRTGHHCALPILRRYGLESSVRASLAFYNTFAELDKLVSIVSRLSRGHR